jgi:raffinose/stachyose/melibiose transport system substrate-binding protein
MESESNFSANQACYNSDMIRQRRTFCALVPNAALLSLLVIGLASCGIGRSSGPEVGAPRKIQVMASDGWIYDVVAETAKLFEKDTGIKVAFTIYAPGVYFRALQTMLNAGEATDIFMMQSTRWYLGSDIDPRKYCIDLTNEEWTKRLKPEWLPAVSYKGRIYGLVVWDDTVGWVYTYNDKIFKRLGLSPPKNTAEFMTLCDRIKQAGILPIYEPGAAGWHAALTFFEMGSTFEQRDPGLYNRLNTNRLTFAAYQPFHLALDQILLAVKSGYFGSDFMTNTIEGSKTALISGAAAMTLNKIGFARSVLKTNPDSGVQFWGMFPIPWLDNRTVSIERSAPTWFGNVRSHDKAAVLQFFRFLTRQDNLEKYAAEQPEGTSLSFPTRPVPLLPNEKSFLGSAKLGGEPLQGGVKYMMAQWMEMEADFEQMLIGAMTPQRFLSNIDKRRANMAAAAKDPAWAQPTPVDSSSL